MKFYLLITLAVTVSAKIHEKKSEKNPKIIGGKDAQIEEFPAVVAIIHTEYEILWCAGTLISELWILTAAHCYIHPDYFVIEHSTTNLLVHRPNAKHVLPKIFIKHDQYNEDELTFDIGLVGLKEPLETGLHIPFSKLAVPGSFYPTGTPAIVAGWGLWSYDNFTFAPLQKAQVEVWNYRDCQEVHRDNPYGLKIHSHQICAGLPDYSKGDCNGDAGGPLYVNGVQVGIVSWSVKPCTVAEYPSVYSDVAYFIPWIEEKTGIKFAIEAFLVRKK